MKNEKNQNNNLLSGEINSFSSNINPKIEKSINDLHNSIYNNTNNFKFEYVIGKGGFGKVRINNKY
jgi:hypothetical protein